MPIYEFFCDKCEKNFEELIRGKGDIPECPKCGNKKVKKQFSSFGFSSGGKTVTSGSKSGCHSCGTHHCSTCG